MNGKSVPRLAALVAVLLLNVLPLAAQQHRATRLGNPETRFATPLQTPEDFRRMFSSETLRADVDFIIRECKYSGDLADLRRAAAEAPVLPLKIPVGTRLPAMSTRKGGKPVLLLDVLWAGKEPIDAYEFFFTSKGRRFRVVSPKACANFWVEDKGKEPRPSLTLECEAPAEVTQKRPAKVCLTIRNTGDGVEPLATVALKFPEGATYDGSSVGGEQAGDQVVWTLTNLAPNSATMVCAQFTKPEPGILPLLSSVRPQIAPAAETKCETKVAGIPAVLLEVIDLEDPIELNTNETYVISVLNQGSTPLTNVKLICTLEESQEYVSGTGITPVTAKERTITLENLAALPPKETAVWRVIVKTLKAGDIRFNTALSCDQFQQPIHENESTRQY